MIFTGLSLKTQELTAVFLIMRIICHFMLIRDIYVVLDSLTLVSTLWVIYMIRFKLKSSYMQELDNMPFYYVVSSYVVHPIFSLLFFTFLISLIIFLNFVNDDQYSMHCKYYTP